MDIVLALIAGIGLGFYLGLIFSLRRFYVPDTKIGVVDIGKDKSSKTVSKDISGTIVQIKEGRKKEDTDDDN